MQQKLARELQSLQNNIRAQIEAVVEGQVAEMLEIDSIPKPPNYLVSLLEEIRTGQSEIVRAVARTCKRIDIPLVELEYSIVWIVSQIGLEKRTRFITSSDLLCPSFTAVFAPRGEVNPILGCFCRRSLNRFPPSVATVTRRATTELYLTDCLNCTSAMVLLNSQASSLPGIDITL